MIQPITEEYLEKIKSDLGAVGVLLIISDSQLPCPDARAGENCTHQHDIYIRGDDMALIVAHDIINDIANGKGTQV